jgi:signal transduction histidine kinase
MFRRAVLRLTLAYSLVQLAIFAAVAGGVYAYVVTTFDFDPAPEVGAAAGADAVAGADALAAAGPDAAEQAFGALRSGLVVAFLVLLVVVPLASWFMARAAIGPLRAGFRAQEHFVDDASHEFRTPLSVLAGELELSLSRERDAAEYREAIRRSLVVTRRLTRLTADLLQLSRGEEGGLGDAFELVELRDVVADAIPPTDAAAGVQVTVETVGNPVVRGSHELLVRAVANVVENAVKFTPAGGRVHVRAGERGGTAEVEVTDTGPGMSAEAAAHAFERFWRADTARSVPGHGLGLALVRQIVSRHHGRVLLEAPAGGGTRVLIALPRVRR